MTERMSKQPVIISANGVQKLNRIPLNSGTFKEEWLQSILAETPSVLPTADIAPIFAPLLGIAREVRLKTDDNNSGRIDNLYISKHGHLVIVETKLWNNPEARREVVGQILDYAKEVKDWDYEKLNAIYREYNKAKGSLFDALVAAGYQQQENEADFIDTVNTNIRNAQFLLMIVGDGIRSGVEKIAEYLNASPDMHHRLALCELEVYELGNGRRLVVPQLTTKTQIIERGIVRIENGSVRVDMSDGLNDDDVHEHPNAEPLTTEELIKHFASNNKNLTSEQISTFVEDLTDLGFLIKTTPRGATVYCPVASMNTYIPLFFFPGIPKPGRVVSDAKLWFVPARIIRRMETLGLATDGAKRLLDAWRPLLARTQKTKPYEDTAKFYFFDDKFIADNKKQSDFLSALEEFKDNL